MVSDGWSPAYNRPHHLPSPTHFHFKLTHSPPVSGHVISKLHIIPAHRIIVIMIMVINISSSSSSSIITILIIFVIIIICKTFWSTLKSIDAKCAKTTNECEMYCMVLHGAAYIGAWCIALHISRSSFSSCIGRCIWRVIECEPTSSRSRLH